MAGQIGIVMTGRFNIGKIVDSIYVDCLGMKRDQPVMVVYDDFGHKIAEAFIEGATAARYACLAVYIPISAQTEYSEQGELNKLLQDTISRSEVLITAITDMAELTRFRAMILSHATASQCKVLHMPGLTLDELARTMHGVDPTSMHDEGARLKQLLDLAEAVEITTEDSSGRGEIHKLLMSLSGRTARLDSGRARQGEIVQIPFGEVYIAPLEGTAEGSIVINGAGPNCVVANERVVLVFRRGTLVLEASHFDNTPNSKRLRDHLQESGRAGTKNLMFAELGIGLNPLIHRFTGNTIVDQRARGSVHIGLGYNVPFGGTIEAERHDDLILVPEGISLDGQAFSLATYESTTHRHGSPED